MLVTNKLMRIGTFLVCFFVNLVIVFVVVLFTICFCVALNSGLLFDLTSMDAAKDVGRLAGKQLGESHGPFIMLCSLIASIWISGIVSGFISFTNLLPWCRIEEETKTELQPDITPVLKPNKVFTEKPELIKNY